MIKTGTAYHLVAETLRGEILSGKLSAGTQLPTEQELCHRFDISRITIRRAMQILEEELLIQRRQGSGTFIAPSPMRKIPILNIGFYGSVARHAPDMERRLLKMQWIEADNDLAAQMRTTHGTRILHAFRADLIKGECVAIDDAYLLGKYADRLTEEDLGDIDFLARWTKKQRLSITHCKQVVEAVVADSAVARQLGIKKGSAALKESDYMYLSGERVAGLFVSYYRPDCFQFTATVPFGQMVEGKTA